MIDHITLRVSDIDLSKEFFTKALAPLGYSLLKKTCWSGKNKLGKRVFGFGIENKEGKRDFWIIEGRTKQEQHSFSCLAFKALNKKMVDEFYKAAIESGGKDNGPPGYRKKYHSGYYAAFVLDPDGHNIEVVFDDLEKI